MTPHNANATPALLMIGFFLDARPDSNQISTESRMETATFRAFRTSSWK